MGRLLPDAAGEQCVFVCGVIPVRDRSSEEERGIARAIEDILMPGGRPVGVKASGRRANAKLRELKGGLPEARQLFEELTEGGIDVTPPGFSGTLIELAENKGTVGFRPSSRSGPPTIDINAIDSKGN